MKRIGMVVAMQKEIIPFIESQKVAVKNLNVCGFDLSVFNLGDCEIYCVRSGVGEIYAAAAAQLLICEYNVGIIINFGVCGALSESVKTGTVYAVKGVAHYDFDLTPFGLEKGQYPDYPSAIVETDRSLLDKLAESADGIREVICASADKFVEDEKIKTELREKYGAEICEMESAGVLMTAKNAGVPCLIIKAVSDGDGGAEEYKKTVNSAAKEYIGIINRLIGKL